MGPDSQRVVVGNTCVLVFLPNYRDLFKGMLKTLRAFAPSSSEFITSLACHHSITNFEINAFLNQDSYRLLKFVSDLVSIFDTG